MSAFLKLLVPFLCVVTLMSACSNGGLSTPEGSQCDENYKPINMNPAPNLQKISLKVNDPALPANTINLPAGNYSYGRADLYYTDNRKASGENFSVHVQDVPQGDGKTFKASVACARNVKSIVVGTQLNTMGVSKIKVTPDPANPGQNTLLATGHKYSFTLTPPNGKIEFDFPLPVPDDPNTLTFTSLEQAFDKSVNPDVLETIMVKHSDATYEIRTRYANPDNSGSWYLSVILSYTK